MPDAVHDAPAVSSAPGRRIFLGVLAASLLVQLAWILAIPSFRGSDEFDHAYKADAVAAGQLRGTVDAPDGRGQLLGVRERIVSDAAPLCSAYDYTGPDDCRAVSVASPGRVQVSSAAASYNPTYYAVVGLPASPLDGTEFVYALRALTALLASTLLAAAAAVTAGWARNRWPLLALAVAVPPTLVFSGAIAAPNGVGYAAAVLWWACAVGLVERPHRAHYALLTVASVTVLVTHTLNVLWLPVMAIAVLALRRRAWWATLLREHRAARVGTVVVLLSALACVAWIRYASTNALNAPLPDQSPLALGQLASVQLNWVFQTVAAAPLRNVPAPAMVYPLWLMALGVVLVCGARWADRRLRLAAGILALAWVAVPLALTVVSYASEGYAWQGRYAYPIVVGVPALAGLALSRRAPAPSRLLSAVVVAMVGTAHVVAVAGAAATEAPLALTPTFADVVAQAPAVCGALALLGVLVALVALRKPTRAARHPDDAPVLPAPSST